MTRRMMQSLNLMLLLALTLSWPLSAGVAETGPIRMAQHDGYSRLVFDFAKAAPYKIVKTDGQHLEIEFEGAPDVKPEALKPALAGNILSAAVVSAKPLRLRLQIPKGSTFRSLKAGSKILLDIYDSKEPQEKPEEKPVEKTKPKSEPKPEQPAKPFGPPAPPANKELYGPLPQSAAPQKNSPQDSAHGSPAQKPETVKTAPAPDERLLAAPQHTDAPAVLPKSQAAPQDAPPSSAVPAPEAQPRKKEKYGPVFQRKAARLEKPSLISLSSINALDLAAFERDRRIWLVSGFKDVLMDPQVAGDAAKSLMPVKRADTQEVKVFQFTRPPGMVLRGQGGGVLWSLILTPQADDQPRSRFDAVPPQRVGSGPEAKIIWPLKDVQAIVEVADPVSGRVMKIATVKNARQFSGPGYDFLEFQALPSPIGLAILPKVPDLQVALTEAGVEIARPNGLVFSSQADIDAGTAFRERRKFRPKADPLAKRIFDFNSWQMGATESLSYNKDVILAGISRKQQGQKAEGLLTLSKMYLAHAMWSEALGLADFAGQEAPALLQNPEFLALRGAIEVLGLQSEEGFRHLSIESLKIFPEVDYWRAAALAHLGDWDQAAQIMPEDLGILAEYPKVLINRLALPLGEIALRAGKTAQASTLLSLVEDTTDDLTPDQRGALDYLKGELMRQQGKMDEAEKLWADLDKSRDQLYSIKAGAALTRLMGDRKKLSGGETINRLERLRYGWRGDELEALVNYRLGQAYFENGDYLKGLTILRDAAGYAAGTDLAETIAAEMTEDYTGLFLSEKLTKVSALDAAVIYSEFPELLPQTERGDRVVGHLADHLVRFDMFARAEDLLQKQLDRRLTGIAAMEGGARLAAVYLMDRKPGSALTVLGKASGVLSSLPPGEQTPARLRTLALLKARALSQLNRAQEAMSVLAGLDRTPDANRLRADIAWRAAYWDDAADALGDIITDENADGAMEPGKSLSPSDVDLIVRRAIALNLGNDRIALAALRQKYGDLIAKTDQARVFEMITRSWNSTPLGDRQTLLSMVKEVDLFRDFLKDVGNKGSDKSTTAAPAKP